MLEIDKVIEKWKPNKYFVKYKCRNCGKIYYDGETAGEVSGDDLRKCAVTVLKEKIYQMGVHACETGVLGIGDIIGVSAKTD